ncbi:MAG TPA: PASTA domain-containing protein [Acidimicrobiales bacterium]
MATSRMTEQIGRVLGGRYRLLSPLGSGASAQVYLADDVRLRRRVAVKVLHPALADDESFLRRFRAEAQSAASLSHPHVLAVFDWSGDDTPFLVTEYLSGGSLRSMLDAGHRLTPAQALVVGLEAARALDYAHRQGFVHRDVKPANLLFGGDGRLRVADFGLARAIAEAGWTEPSGAVLGTARYASPEQARGESVDGRSDVYSLALVMVEAVTGRVPFAADTTIGTLMARLDRPLEVPGELGPLVPILVRAGAVDPGERLDAAALGAGLVEAATGLTRPQPLPLVGAGQPDRPEGQQDTTVLARAPSHPAAGAGGNGSEATHVMRAGNEATSVMVAAPPPGAPPRRPGDTVAVPPVGGPAGPRPPLAEPPPGGLSPNDRGARRLMLGALVVTTAVVVGMAAGWSYMRTQVPSYTVPPLVGLDRSDLAGQIAGFDWVVEIDEVRQDDTDPGEILSTDPAAGEKLREGGNLAVVVSAGATLVPVPTDLVGLTEQEARDKLEAAGLVAGVTRDQSDEFDEGVVMGIQGDELPAELPKGETVTLVVSTGSAALQMPDLEGRQYDEAATALAEMGLVVEPEGERVRRREVGRVISTDPAAGEEVRAGDTVVVVVGVSESDSVTVPDVVGRDYDNAKEAIKDADLDVGDVHGAKDGVVLATWPLPGSQVDEDSKVDLIMRPG